MWKHTWSLVAISFCLSCGGGTQAPAEPATPKPAASEQTPPEEPAGTGSEEPKKKSCAELDKSTCKVTQGCAWNDVKKCIEEGAEEQ